MKRLLIVLCHRMDMRLSMWEWGIPSPSINCLRPLRAGCSEWARMRASMRHKSSMKMILTILGSQRLLPHGLPPSWPHALSNIPFGLCSLNLMCQTVDHCILRDGARVRDCLKDMLLMILHLCTGPDGGKAVENNFQRPGHCHTIAVLQGTSDLA